MSTIELGILIYTEIDDDTKQEKENEWKQLLDAFTFNAYHNPTSVFSFDISKARDQPQGRPSSHGHTKPPGYTLRQTLTMQTIFLSHRKIERPILKRLNTLQ